MSIKLAPVLGTVLGVLLLLLGVDVMNFLPPCKSVSNILKEAQAPVCGQ